jgi:hypothetical protein
MVTIAGFRAHVLRLTLRVEVLWMETYKLEMYQGMTITEGIGSRSSRNPAYTDGFIEELSRAASSTGGTYTSHSTMEQKEHAYSDDAPQSPADWISYITAHAWLFDDLKNFAAFIGTAWGLYEKFKPNGSDIKTTTMTVFIGQRPILIKQGEDIEEIIRRARADDTR